jgi:hypothetical protein
MGTMARWPHHGATACAATIAALAASTPRALAQQGSGEADACFTAAERAQPLMKQRRFREARAELEMCARDVCPRVARIDCRDWLADVATHQPSIVISAHETNSRHETRDLTGVRAVIDGGIVVETADASPVPLDPGRHRVRVERDDLYPLEQAVDLREGEKNRVVHFYWETQWVAPQRPAAVAAARPTPGSVYVVGALGLAAVGVGVYFEATGLAKRASLDTCKQAGCPPGQVDDARNMTRVGDVTLGVGLAALAGAGIIYLARPTERRAAPGREQIDWLLGPLPGGLMAGFRGSL